jgi:hypothetical protein
MKVICISAKAQHGKDTSATILKELYEANGARVLITHYADLLKYICKTFFGWNGEKDNLGRTLLQKVGTNIVCAKQPDFWVDFIINILKLFDDYWDIIIIPDCRYINEIEKMRSNFDTAVIRVVRPNFDNGLSDVQKQHPSETALDNFEFDTVIYNNGSLDELKQTLYEYISTKGL